MTHNSRLAVSVHILAYLAHRGSAEVSSAEIARSVATNPVVIRRLLTTLRQTRIVRVRRGAAGGFALARPPSAISLLEVYRAVEPQPGRALSQFAPNTRCPVGERITGVLTRVFERAQAALEAELARTTLADIDRQLHSVCPGKAAGA